MSEVVTKEVLIETLGEFTEKTLLPAFSSMLDERFNLLDAKLDNSVDELKTNIQRVEGKVDQSLHVEYVNLERRVKHLEHPSGLKTV